MLTELALGVLERLINSYLHLDPTVIHDLSAHRGKSLALTVEGVPPFYFTVELDGLHVSLRAPNEVSASLKGNLWSLFQLQQSTTIIPKAETSITISGDMNFAQDLKRILNQIDIDWEEKLAHWMGDGVAHHVVQGVASTKTRFSEARNDFLEDLTSYLQHEQRLLPKPEQVTEFVVAIDELRDDVARLAVRIEQLKQAMIYG